MIVISCTGELDIATAPEVDRRIADALAAGVRRLVVDLRGLTFMDSTGLVLLARWNLGARQDGFDLSLIQGDARIRRLFTLTGLERHFIFEPDG
jgi:anti-sigma B factor antagonist